MREGCARVHMRFFNSKLMAFYTDLHDAIIEMLDAGRHSQGDSDHAKLGSAAVIQSLRRSNASCAVCSQESVVGPRRSMPLSLPRRKARDLELYFADPDVTKEDQDPQRALFPATTTSRLVEWLLCAWLTVDQFDRPSAS